MEVNLLAVFVCGIVSMVLGFLWYGPVFGKTWIRLVGFTQQQIDQAKAKGMTAAYVINFVSALVMAYVFAHILVTYKAMDIMAGFSGAFWMWLGFIATVTLGKVLWEGKPWSLWFFDNAYYLVLLLVNSIILVSWK